MHPLALLLITSPFGSLTLTLTPTLTLTLTLTFTSEWSHAAAASCGGLGGTPSTTGGAAG